MVWETRLARKRQSIDPTSEWGRYADFPQARARALATLVCRVVPILFVASGLTIIGLSSTTTTSTKSTTQAKKKNNGLATKATASTPSLKKRLVWSAALRQYSGRLLADGLLRLGPLYIKMGQIISCREDLLPPEWVVALERLQDRVPAKSGREALELAYAAFDGGKEEFDHIFSSFDDKPLAAASLGQVHRAVLKPTNNNNNNNNNRNEITVAVKIQRPRLRDIYDKDLELIQSIAKFADKFGTKAGGVEQSWQEIFRDTKEILYREIDYRDEAENAIRFAADFGLGLGGTPLSPEESLAMKQSLKKASKYERNHLATNSENVTLPSAASWLRTPYVYQDLSSERALVMEYVPSVKITNFEKLQALGVTTEDRTYLAECLARAYLRQLCANQFFSTDPHPGNLGVEIVAQEGATKGPRIVVYDFGQACKLAPSQSEGILRVMEAIIDMDPKACVDAFRVMGVLSETADFDMVEQKVRNNFETGKIKVKAKKTNKKASTSTASDIATTSTGLTHERHEQQVVVQADKNANESSKQVSDARVMSYFTLQAEYAFVARALSQMDGVGKALDPDFDFISASAPHLVEIKGASSYLTGEVQKAIGKIQGRMFGWQKTLMQGGTKTNKINGDKTNQKNGMKFQEKLYTWQDDLMEGRFQ